MEDPAFRRWLARRSWQMSVRYCKVVALLLPPAALATDVPLWRRGVDGLEWLLAWQVAAQGVCLAMLAADRWLPRLRGHEAALSAFCGVFIALCAWIGVVDGLLRGDYSIYAAGMTFGAAVASTPRRVRQPLYAASLLALAVAVWSREDGDAILVVAGLVNPFCVVVLCLWLDRITYSRDLALYRETQRAEAERERADAVLNDVLPRAVADELKRSRRVRARKVENLGVLFADIAGFTRYASRLPPEALVLVLDEIFSSFDALVEHHGVEKIKTIGDGYMAVADGRPDALCRLALDMRHALERYNCANGTELAMRIGIHAGPAVAGVLGVKRFLYDVWGDTVNREPGGGGRACRQHPRDRRRGPAGRLAVRLRRPGPGGTAGSRPRAHVLAARRAVPARPPHERARRGLSRPAAGNAACWRPAMALPGVLAARGRPVPRVPGWEHSARFLADPYRFIGRACRDADSDVVQARLLLQPTLCLSGPAAAALFYDRTRFRREGAAPEPVRATLFGKAGVQGLDGEAHLQRKQFFLAVAGPVPTAALLAHAMGQWDRLAARWERQPRLVLYEAAQDWLARAAFRWAGVDVPEDALPARTAQLVALFDGAAAGLAAHLRARRARGRLEDWLAWRIGQHRQAPLFAPGTPAAAAAALAGGDGRLLPARVAAVELLNVLRPIVAISVFVVLAAHALHLHRDWAAPIAAGRESELDAFVQEVRRFYPFFPAVAARTCRDVAWDGWLLRSGTRALLDLYGTNHDARAWVEPYAFRPERFFGLVPGLFQFVPQGGARAEDHHRCPGEGMTVAVMKLALRALAAHSRYRVPAQDLALQMDRMPALPRSRMVLADFRRL